MAFTEKQTISDVTQIMTSKIMITTVTNTVPYIFFFFLLKVAEELGKEDITNLLAQRRLVLLVDLDQTLIHTTNDNIPPNLKVSSVKVYECYTLSSHIWV